MYIAPTSNEPHGIVKLRIVYHQPPDTQLEERVVLDDFTLGRQFMNAREGSVNAVLMRPGPHRWRLRSQFSHTESRREMEQYQERYSCGQDGSGQTRYCTRTQTRWVTKYPTIIDARCDVDQTHVVQEGRNYVAQFDFFGNDRCTLRYFEQRPRPDGSFDLVPRILTLVFLK